MRTVERSTRLAAPMSAVWAWATTPAGINDELRPFMRMTIPKAWAGVSIADLHPPQRLGRSWILLFGIVPMDCDDLTIADVGPGWFRERSRLLTADPWHHDRTVTDVDGGCEVHDRVSFETRAPLRWIPGGPALHRRIIAAVFAHRHRRLRARFGELLDE